MNAAIRQLRAMNPPLSSFRLLGTACFLSGFLVTCGQAPQAGEPGPAAEEVSATAAPRADSPAAAAALAHCATAEKARASGDLAAWEREVKEAFLLFDTKPLPEETTRKVLETVLAYAEATPGEEGVAVAVRFFMDTLHWSPEKRAAYRELHDAERQYEEINQYYTAAESMARSHRQLQEQLPSGGYSQSPEIDPQLTLRRNAAFLLYIQARERFEALPGQYGSEQLSERFGVE